MRRDLGRPSGLCAAGGTILVTLLGLLVLTFAIGRLMPVDPVRAIVGEEADPATYQQVYQELGMDQPVYVQFARYLGDMLRGDFGTSLRTGQPVAEDIASVMPATIELATFAHPARGRPRHPARGVGGGAQEPADRPDRAGGDAARAFDADLLAGHDRAHRLLRLARLGRRRRAGRRSSTTASSSRGPGSC